jgi:superfamily II DNA or RNA helicase
MLIEADSWCYSRDHGQLCQVIEAQELWGETICRVWLPQEDVVIHVDPARLVPLSEYPAPSEHSIAYAAAAGRVADALSRDILLAPFHSTVIPLPHQIAAVSRAVSGNRVRYLLADEVGLGKTIEAGLIMRELKLRGLVRRTLIIVPRGLLIQWVSEMRTHFNEDFRLLIPADFAAYRRIAGEENLWRTQDQIVCPMDSVKPLEGRRGWTSAQVDQYNRERFEDLIGAGWDLVIVDEAHRLAGGTEQVARYRLGQGLAEASPYFLLLSATPHQGKTDAFHRLVSLLDAAAFPDLGAVSRDRVRPYVIRTEKRQAVNPQGEPLFKPRHTRLVPIAWGERHQQQRHLYEAVTEYVREGYNRAVAEKRNYVGFLMLLMQRLVTSSTRAIRSALERRLEVLGEPEDQLSLSLDVPGEEWSELDGQEQFETLLQSRLRALEDERDEIEALLRTARTCESSADDAKAEALLEWIYRLQQEETDPNLKVLLFTEFVATQDMLRDFLVSRGFSVACLNGSMDAEERRQVQDTFASEARVLVSTDAGGEGLNLQFCHVVVNYDIPWNPMRLEQRIGRADRIGQEHIVRAINFVLEDTVEYRVRQVLEEKLAIILEEFGVDKSSDVLDSAESEAIFDALYASAVANPEKIEEQVDSIVQRIREEAERAKEGSTLLASDEQLDTRSAQELIEHPIGYWVERMTTSYLSVFGTCELKRDGGYRLVWPDGTETGEVAFSQRDGERRGTAVLTLEDARVRGLATRLPRFVPGLPIPIIRLGDISAEITGLWSLWRIAAYSADWRRERTMPLFVHDDGRVLMPTARRIWERLIDPFDAVSGHIERDVAIAAFAEMTSAAETHGQSIYQELLREHRDYMEREREKGLYSFQARRRIAERIGLQTVRAHRLAQIEQEESRWRESLEERAEIKPEMVAITVARIEGGLP